MRVIASYMLLVCLVNSGEPPVSIEVSPNDNPIRWRASGFLHSIGDSFPVDERIRPLRPQLWRMSPQLALTVGPRAAKLGAVIQVVISDSHGYRSNSAWPGDDGNWSGWETLVEEVVQSTAKAVPGRQLDLWNEADGKRFWQRDRNRFLEAWSRAWRIAKRLDPDSRIVGPSYSLFDQTMLNEFLDHCARAGTLPDVLSWHELDPRFNQAIAEHVTSARQMLDGRGLQVVDIAVNEYLARTIHQAPGHLVAAIAQLEASPILGACRSCWRETDGKNNGFNSSLDGLLTPEQEPRPTWWVMRQYGELEGLICKSSSSLVLSAYDKTTRRLGILVPGALAGTVIRIVNLPAASWLVQLALIPDQGERPLSSPISLMAPTILVPDPLTFRLPTAGSTDAFVIHVSPGAIDGSAPPR